MPVLMLGGLGVCAGYACALWMKEQEPPKGKDPNIKHASLGVIRLDWSYSPLPGDVGSSDSFEYPVYYRAVEGLTFEVCQKGEMTDEIKARFKEAIRYLDQDKQVSVIISDCGFFMWFQKLARDYTNKPVVMSSLALLPAIHAAVGKTGKRTGKIAIFTANRDSLKTIHETVAEEMPIDWTKKCYLLVDCRDVPGFEAVATGEPVDFDKVSPGIVKKAVELTKNHRIDAFLFECTQLPPFSDDVRAATGLPVYDAVVCADFFVRGFVDNPRFGLNDWQQSWDGKQEAYQLGDVEDKEKLVHYNQTH